MLTTDSEFSEFNVEKMFNGDVSVRLEKIADFSSFLLPDEKKIVASVVQKRREEFSTGRFCARSAIQEITPHLQPTPILSGEKRQPLWPDAIIGSISHSDDSCLAVVSRDPAIRSLGVDVEKRAGIKPAVRDLICSSDELKMLGEYQHNPEAWKLIFSAKESVYKALFPLIERWIGFSHAFVCFDFEQQSFIAKMNSALKLPEDVPNCLAGRFSITADSILTVVEIPASQSG